MVLKSSEIASNRPWTSVLIFGGIPEPIVLTLVPDLALTNVYILVQARKTGDYTSAARKFYTRVNNRVTCTTLTLLTPSY